MNRHKQVTSTESKHITGDMHMYCFIIVEYEDFIDLE